MPRAARGRQSAIGGTANDIAPVSTVIDVTQSGMFLTFSGKDRTFFLIFLTFDVIDDGPTAIDVTSNAIDTDRSAIDHGLDVIRGALGVTERPMDVSDGVSSAFGRV